MPSAKHRRWHHPPEEYSAPLQPYRPEGIRRCGRRLVENALPRSALLRGLPTRDGLIIAGLVNSGRVDRQRPGRAITTLTNTGIGVEKADADARIIGSSLSHEFERARRRWAASRTFSRSSFEIRLHSDISASVRKHPRQ